MKIYAFYSKIRKHFISDVLGIPLEQIKSVRMANTFLWKRYRRDKEGKEFSELFEIHIIELRKKLDGTGQMDDWIRLINARTEEDLDMIKTENAGYWKQSGR